MVHVKFLLQFLSAFRYGYTWIGMVSLNSDQKERNKSCFYHKAQECKYKGVVQI